MSNSKRGKRSKKLLDKDDKWCYHIGTLRERCKQLKRAIGHYFKERVKL